MVFNTLPMSPKLEETKNAYTILYGHCFIKGLQFGTVMGGVSGTAVTLYQTLVKKKAFNLKRLPKYMNVGMLILTPLTMGLCYKKAGGNEYVAIQKRAFKLQRNYHQNRVDYLFLGGAGVGQVAKIASKAAVLNANHLAGFDPK